MASIESRENGRPRVGDVVTIADGAWYYDVTRIEPAASREGARGASSDDDPLVRVWPNWPTDDVFSQYGQWVSASLLHIVCPEPARSGYEQAEHDEHCCECGTTSTNTAYRSRGGYRRCFECDTTHLRTLAFASSGKPLPIDKHIDSHVRAVEARRARRQAALRNGS